MAVRLPEAKLELPTRASPEAGAWVHSHHQTTVWHDSPGSTASPLSLTEPFHGSEPGSKVLLRSNAVIVAGGLQQLDLGDHFELLSQGRQGGDGPMRVGQGLAAMSSLATPPLTPTQAPSCFTVQTATPRKLSWMQSPSSLGTALEGCTKCTRDQHKDGMRIWPPPHPEGGSASPSFSFRS